MISAKEVNERAAVTRERIATEEKTQKIRLRKRAEVAAAPVVEEMLTEIEAAIERAIDAGAYAICYPVYVLKDTPDKAMKTAYRTGLIKPLREAGFNASFRLDNTGPHELSIRWEGA